MGSHELVIGSAFLTGLLGSLHCIGMCGGIVSALTFGLPETIRNRPTRLLPYLLAYNGGRIASYALAGTIMGLLGAKLSGALQYAWIGREISALFMIALGLYLAGWWRGLAVLERAGGHLWARIEPLSRRLFPVKSPFEALGLGLLWGWLPCGMVYTMLAAALVTGSPSSGALVLVAFGLGTLPTLLLIGGAARWLATLTRQSWLRQMAGLVVILFGIYGMGAPFLMKSNQGGHGHGGHATSTQPSTEMPAGSSCCEHVH